MGANFAHIIGDERTRGSSGRDNHMFVEAVLWIVRTGSPGATRRVSCPVRFTLTAGQTGDAPQADALIEGLPPTSSWPIPPMTAIACATPSQTKVLLQ